MTPERVNKFLTLWMGECWHEFTYYFEIGEAPHKCNICGITTASCGEEFYDFSTPTDFFRLKEWMEKNQGELWEDYLERCIKSVFDDWGENGSMTDNRKLYAETLHAQLNPSNLVQFLVEHREEWEWRKCVCEDDEDDNYEWGCSICNGKGKIQHTAAKYIDKIRERKEREIIEYGKCKVKPKRNADCVIDCDTCVHYRDGKIQHPAAKYLDSLREE